MVYLSIYSSTNWRSSLDSNSLAYVIIIVREHRFHHAKQKVSRGKQNAMPQIIILILSKLYQKPVKFKLKLLSERSYEIEKVYQEPAHLQQLWSYFCQILFKWANGTWWISFIHTWKALDQWSALCAVVDATQSAWTSRRNEYWKELWLDWLFLLCPRHCDFYQVSYWKCSW